MSNELEAAMVEEVERARAKDEKRREKELRDECKQLNKKNHPHRRTFKFILIALLVGIVIGAGAVLWIQHNQPSSEKEPVNVSVVFARVVKQDELVTASQKYQVTEKVRDANKFFDLFEIPFTENSYWYRYVGTVKAAVDLRKAKLVGQDGKKITISLEQPYISSNTPDMNESCALEENNNILNPIHITEVDEYKKLTIEKVEEEAKNGDLFEEARANAASDLSQLFSVALGGEYEVVIQWQDAKE